jgi:hypothetical protein
MAATSSLAQGTRPRVLAAVAAMAAALVLLAAACGGDDDTASKGSGSGGGSGSKAMTIKIVKPKEAYADGVNLTFDTNVPIGKTDTGEHHIHLYRDGNTSQYDIAYSKSLMVKDLKPGEHTLKAVIANPDHSLTDASDEVKIDVEKAEGKGDKDSGQTGTTSDSGY